VRAMGRACHGVGRKGTSRCSYCSAAHGSCLKAMSPRLAAQRKSMERLDI
jgi:hypothetical protein